jgi:hypothetical protein
MKIVGFGDSFILGNELQSEPDGSCAWPGLIAQQLGIDYSTDAFPGVGNDHIAQQVFTYFFNHSADDTLAVINWTWHMRWDLWINARRTWIGLGPTCVPERLYTVVDNQSAQELVGFYKKHLEPNEIWNKQRNLSTIYATQCFLEKHNIKNIQTFMDAEIWNRDQARLDHYRVYKDSSWPIVSSADQIDLLPDRIQQEVNNNFDNTQSSSSIRLLQDLTRPALRSFDGVDFLTWSYQKGFEVTDLLHPLQQAHDAAAQYWLPHYQRALND